MKLWQLEQELQTLQGFEKPNVKLEQYMTPPEIAARFLFSVAQSFPNAVEDAVVADFGAGTGMLAHALQLLGAATVFAVEFDEDVVPLLRAQTADWENCHVVRADLLCGHAPLRAKSVDTVVMNPPFGTKRNKGADVQFVQRALEVAERHVFSLHKSSTRAHIQKKCKQWGCKGEVIAELRYNLDKTYGFHKQASKDIQVDVWRFYFS